MKLRVSQDGFFIGIVSVRVYKRVSSEVLRHGFQFFEEMEKDHETGQKRGADGVVRHGVGGDGAAGGGADGRFHDD